MRKRYSSDVTFGWQRTHAPDNNQVPLEPIIRQAIEQIAGREGATLYISRYVRRILRFYYGFLVGSAVAAVFTVDYAWAAWNGDISPVMPAVGMCFWMLSLYIWPFIQHLPPVAKLIFGHSPRLAKVAGHLVQRPGFMLVTAHGDIVDERLLASALVPLLIMNDPFLRKLVRTPSNHRYGKLLFVVQADLASAAQPRLNTNHTLVHVIDQVTEAAVFTEPIPAVQPERKPRRSSKKPPSSVKVDPWTKLRELHLSSEEIARRVNVAVIPVANPIREAKIRSGLHGFLPVMLASAHFRQVADAYRAAAARIEASHGQAGASSDSIDWFRKLVHVPPVWLIDALKTPPGQQSLEFGDEGIPRHPNLHPHNSRNTVDDTTEL